MRITVWSDFNCPYSYIGFKRLNSAVTELGLEFEWILKSLIIEEKSDTIDAHRLIKYISKHDNTKVKSAVFKIYEAEFENGEDISDINLLVDIALELGFKKSEVYEMLRGDLYKIEVMLDCEDAYLIGINSVPVFKIEIGEHKLYILEALKKSEFKSAINDIVSGEILNKLS